MMRAVSVRHSLFCALRPPPDLACQLWREFDWLERGDDRVEPKRMHVTLIPLGVWTDHPARTIERAREACGSIEASPFRIVFDDLVVGKRILLKPTEELAALARFRRRLASELVSAGLTARTERASDAHLTASYRTRTRGGSCVTPVSWTVRDFVLIESLVGARMQIERGRWALG